ALGARPGGRQAPRPRHLLQGGGRGGGGGGGLAGDAAASFEAPREPQPPRGARPPRVTATAAGRRCRRRCAGVRERLEGAMRLDVDSILSLYETFRPDLVRARTAQRALYQSSIDLWRLRSTPGSSFGPAANAA